MIHNHHSNLARTLNKILLEGKGFPHQSSGGFRPSEASVTISTPNGPKTLGHCPRATWYRLKGTPPSNIERLPHQERRMRIGKLVEDALVEDCKYAGIFLDRNVPFRATLDNVLVSGELDVVCRQEPLSSSRYLIEAKSIYGYLAQKDIFGRAFHLGPDVGKPRDSYIMQPALYLRYFSTLPTDHPLYIPYGVIYVCDRGDGHACTFDIWLNKETRLFGGGDESTTIHEIYYHSDDLNIPDTRVPYTVEDVLQSFRNVQNLLSGEEPPPRPFVREYDQEMVELRYRSGDISESAYKKWMASHGPRGKGKEVLGDWSCGKLYCQWSDLCWET